MVGQHHQFNAHELVQTPGDDAGQGTLECYRSRGHKESDMTWQLNKTHWMATATCVTSPTYVGET